MENFTELSLVTILAIIISKMIDLIQSYLAPKKTNGNGYNKVLERDIDTIHKKTEQLDNHLSEIKNRLADVHTSLDNLINMHRVTDQDGVPLWYVPRSWNRVQIEICEILREINHTCQKNLEIAVKVDKALERWLSNEQETKRGGGC